MDSEIFITIIVTSILQSIFGTGVLLFGTPILLMLGNDFQALIVTTSINSYKSFQIRNNLDAIDGDFGTFICYHGLTTLLFFFYSIKY